MRIIMRKLAMLGFALALVLSTVVSHAQQYTLINLCANSPYSQVIASGINNLGHITGYGVVAQTGEQHAFIYINGVYKDLGLLGYTSTDGYQINDSDQVAVDAFGGSQGGADVLLYANGTARPIGSLDGGFNYALGMNNLGDIVGEGRNGEGGLIGFAFVGGRFNDLTSLGILRAYAINDSEAFVGVTSYYYGYHNYYQSLHGCLYAGGVLTDLGSLTGDPTTNTAAFGINNAGDIVGCSTGADGLLHAILYTNGAMQDLGTFNGANTTAVAINSSGQIIGEQIDSYGILPYGPSFLYQNGTMTDLSNLIASGGAGWSGLTAAGINAKGAIVGNGTYNGNTQGFLLLPVTSTFPASVSFKPGSVIGGGRSTCTVTLNAQAPAGGLVINIVSSNPSVVSAPSRLPITAGFISKSFTVKSKPVASADNVTVSATYQGATAASSLSVLPPNIKSVTLSANSVTGGQAVTGAINLSGAVAQGATLTVNLSSSNASAATVPATATIAAGQTSGTFAVSTSAVSKQTSVTITAKNGSVGASAKLTVNP
jgi:probable HAF family extracellular repeat protein